jgi:2-hydroxycyclohexanecarboxyl-CoA dehydrogenase
VRGLNGKPVILTGGASGIGREAALRLAQEGAIVGIFDINARGAATTVEKIGGGRAKVYEVDISDRERVAAAHAAFEDEFGPTQGLANVAGWDSAKMFLESDPAVWEKIIRINLYGPLVMHHVVVRGMAERGVGRVVNVSSDAGRVGSSGESVYAACKGGIISFTKTLARELARTGVTLNVLCPGPTDTPFFNDFTKDMAGGDRLAEGLAKAIPMRRLGRPDDYAGMIAFLLSDEAPYMTGQTISISGGLTMA